MTGTTLADLTPLSRIEALSSGRLTLRDGDFPDLATTTLSPLHNLVVDEGRPSASKLAVKHSLLEILGCLRAIDYAFEHRLDYRRHVYVYDDISLHALLDLDTSQAGTPRNTGLSEILEVLGCLGLIYRFNVAPKFGLDEAKMQLRLNGWGRIACDEYELERTSAFTNALDDVMDALDAKENEYRELLRLCNSDERPLDTNAIASIIGSIPLTVVT